MGVPMIGCECPVCTSTDPKNARTRAGILVQHQGVTLLIDTGPELRLQLVAQGIRTIDGVVYTHSHADHILGVDDLRIFGFRQQNPIPLYCERVVENTIRRTFSYAFTSEQSLHSRPRLVFHTIDEKPFRIEGLLIQPIRLMHGYLKILGFRIGDVAICTDVSEVPEQSWSLLDGVNTLVIGAIRDEPHPTHFTVAQAIDVAKKCGAKQTYLTHVSHSLDYEETNARLPKSVQLAYDGQVLPLHVDDAE